MSDQNEAQTTDLVGLTADIVDRGTAVGMYLHDLVYVAAERSALQTGSFGAGSGLSAFVSVAEIADLQENLTAC
ncbi:hypothetical protein ACWGTO_09940 [Mesorhizobium sp. PL10]